MKTCFVISPIGQEGSEVREHADDVFDFIVKPAAERAGYAVKRADHDARPGSISEQMYDSILSDDLIIAVLAFHNPNVFYEVAIAEAAARPLILLNERCHQIPFDIRDRRVLFYDLKPRKLLGGEYADDLMRAIAELEGVRDTLKVPFRPSLKPLGAGETTWRIVPRAEDIPRGEIVGYLREARSFVWFHGVALFAYTKIMGFEEALREKLAGGLECRVLLMHPANPALEHILRDFAPDYADMIRREIEASAIFWTRVAEAGTLNLRFHAKGAVFGNLIQTDARVMFTQRSLVRESSECPTIIGPAGVPFYESSREDFEWSWNRAAHDI